MQKLDQTLQKLDSLDSAAAVARTLHPDIVGSVESHFDSHVKSHVGVADCLEVQTSYSSVLPGLPRVEVPFLCVVSEFAIELSLDC